jgi:enoyl-CoA hydratase/carnithine racemase
MLYDLVRHERYCILRLRSEDGQNRLTRLRVRKLTATIEELAQETKPVIITGNNQFFSTGADLNEVAALTAPEAFAFAKEGQRLMDAIAAFPALTIAAISGYCFGGGLDLALSCHRRIASPTAVFGHRGAALGLITGWGGTQRMPRSLNRSTALAMFLQAEKIDAERALDYGLVHEVCTDSLEKAMLAAHGYEG